MHAGMRRHEKAIAAHLVVLERFSWPGQTHAIVSIISAMDAWNHGVRRSAVSRVADTAMLSPIRGRGRA